VSSTAIDRAAGWHGKLPSLGDFASRRLDGDFVGAWDAWLAQGLAALRTRDGWLDAYLASPSWCFLLMPQALPGAPGRTAWAGVLMPSVDRAGRYYPFTLAQPLASVPASADAAHALWRWLRRADDAAAQALLDDWDVPTLDAELQRLGLPPGDGPQPTVETVAGASDAAGPVALLCAQAAALWHECFRGKALWWSAADDAPPRLLTSSGLEDPALVERLFGAGLTGTVTAPETESAQTP
jgi:type VI secretion system protein ImpM